MNIVSKILTFGLLLVALPLVANGLLNNNCNIKKPNCTDRNSIDRNCTVEHSCSERTCTNDRGCNDRCVEGDCIVGAYTGLLSGSFYGIPGNSIVAQFNPGGTMTLIDVGSTSPSTPTTAFVGTWRCVGINTYVFKVVSTGAFISCPNTPGACGSIADIQYITITGTITFDVGCQNGTGVNLVNTGWTDYTLTQIRFIGTGPGGGGPFTQQKITLLRYPNA